ncbi:AraC-like transcriptional regulator QhpR [Acetobacter oeni]|uniref:AraC family transcriptional regulator n=1 Tax=Acetobacter oeni TaxID=304077 RepID=A0A511XK96_9PROT|nr:AraC family transcriptional regulator [Acetobacter oeni]MBB3883877.1 AraC-like DNA-binding protein [Acetobacter oeni]GBR03497.1 AraC family transcriptional regulator [Acetobacter oeni LMG 21952]GEN63370.1 AraC family transcriptional regulator [Acetobacter oeni]
MTPERPENRSSVLAAAMTGAGSFIRRQGCDETVIARAVGLDIVDDLSPTAALQLSDYCALFEELARQSGYCESGLVYGRQFRPDMLGLIGFIALASPTLANAVENLATLFPWHQHNTHTRLVRTESGLRLEYQITDPAIVARRQDAELTMGMFCNVFRHVLGSDWAPDAIWLEHARHAPVSAYDDAFAAPVQFRCGMNAVLFTEEQLEIPMPGANVALLAVLRESLLSLAHNPATPERSTNLLSRVRKEIRRTLPHGAIKLPALADTLGVPRWTLQRRLDDLGVTYTDLVDGTRRAMATDYLRQKTMPVGEIAFLLGYSEVSAFSRAFRKWYGISPQAFRQQQAK